MAKELEATEVQVNKLLEDSSAIVKKLANKITEANSESDNVELVAKRNKIMLNDLKMIEDRKTNVASTSVDAGSSKEITPGVTTLSQVFDDSMKKKDYLWVDALDPARTDLDKGDNSDLPILTEHGEARSIPQTTTANFHNDSAAFNTFNTASINIQTKRIGNQIDITSQLERRGIISTLDYVKRQDSSVYLKTIADITLNADSSVAATGNINSDDQLAATTYPATTEGYKVGITDFDGGLRKGAINAGDGVGTKVTNLLSGVQNIFDIAVLLKYGTPADNILLMDNATYYGFLGTADFKDASMNGQTSTITTGARTNIAGVDLFVTELLKKSAADGKINGIAGATGTDLNVTGNILMANRDTMQRGWKDGIETQTTGDLFSGITYKSAARYGQGSLDGVNGRKVSMGIDVTV